MLTTRACKEGDLREQAHLWWSVAEATPGEPEVVGSYELSRRPTGGLCSRRSSFAVNLSTMRMGP